MCRERYDLLLEKDMGSGHDLNIDAVGHHHSRDSAIDTDLHELDMETLEVDLVWPMFLLFFKFKF